MFIYELLAYLGLVSSFHHGRMEIDRGLVETSPNGLVYTVVTEMDAYLVDGTYWIRTDINPSAGKKARGALPFVENPIDGETVTINDQAYRFQTIFTDTANRIAIQPTPAANAAALIAAASGGAGAGSIYGAGTVAPTDVNVRAGGAHIVECEAATVGTGPNAYDTLSTSAINVFPNATLLGGLAATPKVVSGSYTIANGYYS